MRIGACALVVSGLVVGACSGSVTPVTLDTSVAAASGFPGCTGTFDEQPSPTGAYYATDFGCSSNPHFDDPGDSCGSAACISSGFSEGVCSVGMSNADCQRAVNWYSSGGASYGCGTRLLVTNPENGNSAVVMVLDNGPSCTVENQAGFWVLDVSYPTIMYLFGQEKGYSDRAKIQVTVVSSSIPLGPTSASGGAPPTSSGSGSAPPAPASSIDAGATSARSGPGAPSDAAAPTSCVTDGDCNLGQNGSGKICTNGQCVTGCNADWECPGIQVCVVGTCI
jgi:hypothetical protein